MIDRHREGERGGDREREGGERGEMGEIEIEIE